MSLHAGELAPGLVPPEGLCCHVRLAVDVAKRNGTRIEAHVHPATGELLLGYDD